MRANQRPKFLARVGASFYRLVAGPGRGGEGTEVLKVAPINPEPGQYLAFLLDGETVGQPYVGRSPGDEGCPLG